MKVERKKSRKLLFQKLYATCFSEFSKDIFMESFFDGVFDFAIDDKYIDEMYDLIIKNEKYLIEVIRLYAPKFEIKKMNIIYVLPIYIGACEMLYFSEEIPGKVSINESVEIAKAFGDTSARNIVNGVLNKLYLNFLETKKMLDTIDIKGDFTFFKK